MNLVWHIVKKDLRSARWLMLAVGVLQVLFLLAGTRNWGALLPVLTWLLVACGTAWLVAEDPLLGGRARWITMPIAPWRLRAAKVMSVALFFWLLPSVVHALAYARSGGSPYSVFWVVICPLWTSLFLISAAFMVSTLTHDLLRFLIGFFAVAALPIALELRGLPWLYLLRSPGSIHSHREVLRSVVFLGGFLLVVGFVVRHQYHTRRTGRSGLLALAGLGLLWLTLEVVSTALRR